ncbi:hypothetical protein EHS25_003174 [Saitozyma podzolica]|uniref:Multiple myeloma tumor-associated protein 2-like N-terminal domain-containing protein n=1 Tax=Saitozyma podzolica TaxID=1890683 RepID=A0A427Y864_9TREE|nr:hypothetical protein EHS25_003174 [Saitozyma podzolica]
MYDGPVRGGNRGGAGDFKWSAVVEDKDRENYLGHSVNAPQGRWQKNKDIHWYARDKADLDADAAAQEKRAEMKRLKEAEEEALSIALGFAPNKKAEAEDGGVGTGANGVAVGGRRDEEIERLEKEEKQKEKA